MQINSVDNQSFQAKKFRQVYKLVNYDREGTQLVNLRNCGKVVKEYSNPNAKKLYKQAQKTTDINEQIRLYVEMGDFEIKRLNTYEKLREWFYELRERFNNFAKDNQIEILGFKLYV